MDDGCRVWRIGGIFEKIAVVTDRDWITLNAMRMFLLLWPAKTKLFTINQMQDAVDLLPPNSVKSALYGVSLKYVP